MTIHAVAELHWLNLSKILKVFYVDCVCVPVWLND